MDALNNYSDSDASPCASKPKDINTSPLDDVNTDSMEIDQNNVTASKDSKPRNPSPAPMGTDSSKSSPLHMDSELTEPTPDPLERAAEPNISVPMETDDNFNQHSPVPLLSETEGYSPVPMDIDLTDHSMAYKHNDANNSSTMEDELTRRSSTPPESDPKHKANLEATHTTSSDDSFLDSSPALSPHLDPQRPKVSETMDPDHVTSKAKSDPDSMEDTGPSHHTEDVKSPLKSDPYPLEDSYAMEESILKEEPIPDPDIKPEYKNTNGGLKRSLSPQQPPSKLKPKVRTNSKPFIYQPPRRPAMTRDELKQCSSILKALKRHPESGPFLQPVDIKKLKIPDYPSIIKSPMDLDTAEKKLNVCAYDMVEEFFADIQRIFDNCYLYNGVDAYVSVMAKSLQNRFIELKDNFSRASEIIEQESALPSAQKGYSTKPPKPRSKQISRKASQSHFHLDDSPGGRYSPLSGSRYVNDMPEHHKKFCNSVLKELNKKLHLPYSSAFLEPVDWQAMNLPDYPHIIKHPMDLSTVKAKFLAGEYGRALDFEQDIRLIFQNCFKYNPESGQVHQMGLKLKSVFEEKWAQRPIDLKTVNDDGLSSGETSEDFESKPVHSIPRKSIDSPLIEPKQETRGRKRKESAPPLEGTRPLPTKTTKPRPRGRKPSGITYAQKKMLSEAINHLPGSMLNVVVDLIHRNLPEIGSSQKEIELDIDALDSATLTKLYDYVMVNAPLKIKQKEAEPRRPREETSSKASRRMEYPQNPPKNKPAPSSSSSSSDSDSESGSSALHKSSKTSKPPKPNLSSKSATRVNADHPQKPLTKPKKLADSPRSTVKPKRLADSSKSIAKPNRAPDSPKSIAKHRRLVESPRHGFKTKRPMESPRPNVKPKKPVHSPPPKFKPRPKAPASPRVQTPPAIEDPATISPPKKLESKPLTTVDESWAKIQANIRLEARKSRTPIDPQQQAAQRREKKQHSIIQRNEEEARRVVQLKRSLEEAAFAKAQQDKRIRLAIGANRKDLLYQNRLMRQYEDKMTQEIRLEQEQSRNAAKRQRSISSISPPPSNNRDRQQLEDGEIEEGELFE